MDVQLIVTGDMEKAAFDKALSRAFPFAGNEPVVFRAPHKAGSFTSMPLAALDSKSFHHSNVRVLARTLLTFVERDSSNRDPADLVIVLDDLELANLMNPKLVVDSFKRAVSEEIDDMHLSMKSSEKLRERVRQRASFHLCKPMPETLFFASTPAREVLRLDSIHVSPTEDIEEFEALDPKYLLNSSVLDQKKRNLDKGHGWWKPERHPKRYIEFLLERTSEPYSETSNGARALRAIDWSSLGGSACPFLASLFADISEALGHVSSPLAARTPCELTWPSPTVDRSTLILRNV